MNKKTELHLKNKSATHRPSPIVSDFTEKQTKIHFQKSGVSNPGLRTCVWNKKKESTDSKSEPTTNTTSLTGGVTPLPHEAMTIVVTTKCDTDRRCTGGGSLTGPVGDGREVKNGC